MLDARLRRHRHLGGDGLRFRRLPFVALIAWFSFGETPDVWTWVGAAVIVSATVYIAHREAVLARGKAQPARLAGASHAADD